MTTTDFRIPQPYEAPECDVVASVVADIVCTSPFGTDPIGEDPDYPIF